MHPSRIINEDLNSIIKANLDWSKFENKTILISGANGFIASYIVESLLHLQACFIVKNITILALVRNKFKAEQKFLHHCNNKSLVLIEQDISKSFSLSGKIDYIIHAASQASPKYYGTDPVGTLNANVLGTHNLLSIAKENNIEGMLFFSSGEVYGTLNEDVKFIKETDYGYLDPCNVRSCYAESKRMGENMCICWAKQYNINISIVRPFHTYGPGMLLDDGRVFADFTKNIVNNEDVVLSSDGSAIRAFCYLADATVAYFTVLLTGLNCESYNVGNPAGAISIKNLAITLADLYKEKEIKLVYKENDAKSYLKSPILTNIPNIDKIASLGWHPQTTIEQGFKRTIESYQL